MLASWQIGLSSKQRAGMIKARSVPRLRLHEAHACPLADLEVRLQGAYLLPEVR